MGACAIPDAVDSDDHGYGRLGSMHGLKGYCLWGKVLPDTLGGALEQAARATERAMQNGVTRCQVELLLPELWDPSSGAVFAGTLPSFLDATPIHACTLSVINLRRGPLGRRPLAFSPIRYISKGLCTNLCSSQSFPPTIPPFPVCLPPS